MIAWLALGLVAGLVLGFAAGWWAFGRGGAPAEGQSLAPEPDLAALMPAGDRTDDEMHQALDATRGLLDELEGRYRGRTAPPEGEAKPKRRPPRRG